MVVAQAINAIALFQLVSSKGMLRSNYICLSFPGRAVQSLPLMIATPYLGKPLCYLSYPPSCAPALPGSSSHMM
jgi:hypothetical protein